MNRQYEGEVKDLTVPLGNVEETEGEEILHRLAESEEPSIDGKEIARFLRGMVVE